MIYTSYRAIDVQALVGNVGGYVGLCLGYSFLQIPDLILFIMLKLKTLRIRRNSTGTLPLHIVVQENHQRNIPDSRANSLELNLYDAVHSLQMQLQTVTEKLDTMVDKLTK